MQLIVFLLFYPILWFFSILPFKVLYFLSDCLYVVAYHIIGYRKKVVFGNLKLVFPEKDKKEIQNIAKEFYSHFIDIFFVEMVKSFTMSKSEITKRFKIHNTELLDKLYEEGKDAILLGAHYANWEWLFSLNLKIKYNGYAVYKKVNNKYLNKKIEETRGRFNTTLIPTKEIFDKMAENANNNIRSLYGFLGDQSPKAHKAHHWNTFLGVYVPIYTGAEFLAKKYNMAIVFFKTKKIKRGYYESTLELLTDNPNNFDNYELTDNFLKKAEQQIIETPQYYLWTHKRFKHKDKKPVKN
ncbi:MAG: lipid A biosynthesis acyltransferase [Flavobacteriaceae bacterium]|nr:lipid A biosynthesis acyltransferase [Flavobacteriaceae bacterium]